MKGLRHQSTQAVKAIRALKNPDIALCNTLVKDETFCLQAFQVKLLARIRQPRLDLSQPKQIKAM